MGPRSKLVVLTPSFVLCALIVSACSDDSCKNSSDCKTGELCKSGKCRPGEVGSDTDDTESSPRNSDETPSDAATDSATTDSATEGRDSETDSASGDAPGTDSSTTEPCLPTQINGDSCTRSCECTSAHCEGGICCPDGEECCASKSDCENDLCVNVGCRAGNYCAYGTTAYPCGTRDEDGVETCTGAKVCNGDGDCLPIVADCSPFAEDRSGVYTCGEQSAVASCHTDCTALNESVHCADGAVCVNGQCVAGGALTNGAECTNDDQCASGHCDHGLCCAEGTCCLAAEDCSDECRTSSCSDFMCTVSIYRGCGAVDTAGEDTCDGDHRCDGAGNCLAIATSCEAYAGDGTYVCMPGDAVDEGCHTSCTSAGQCANGYTCTSDGACVLGEAHANGEACSGDALCSSGHCNNGFCCDSGTCCSVASDCKDLCAAYSCQSSECVMETPLSCGASDDAGEQTCTNNARCDGSGACLSLEKCDGAYQAVSDMYTCVPGERVEETCRTACNTDSECNPGFVCDTEANTCETIQYAPNGETCATDATCQSGHCSNGFCCDEGPCCGEADDCPAGRCVYEVCADGQCDATYRVPCGYPDTEGTYSYCGDGALCDGLGGCVPDITRCDGPYAWNGDYTCAAGVVAQSCFSGCASNLECNTGFGCVTGTCVALLENGEGPCSTNAACLSNHCNPETGVCCAAGMCCADNADCGGYSCDLASNACDIFCDIGSGDDDSICGAFGDYHCDDGQCESDLGDGETLCDEASDCASGYCDTRLIGMCCRDDSAPCCQNNGHCAGGYACVDHQCAGDCSPDGAIDDALCDAGFHCVGDTCVQNTQPGGVGCTSDAACGGGNKCENNVCCSDDEGACCRSDAACDDANPCTDDICLPSYHCVNLKKRAGTSCDADGLFCTGTDTCDDTGVCRPGEAPCRENAICQTGASCDEENDICIPGEPNPNAVGTDCSDALFCLNGRTKTCDASGNCTDPAPKNGVPCIISTADDCTMSTCDEAANACVIRPKKDGTPCNDGDPCTGENQCQDGVCVPGDDPPCADDNPCTTDPCTVVDHQPVCGTKQNLDGAACNDGYACFGTGAVCEDGRCIANEDVCADDMGICTVSNCKEQYFGKTSCGERTRNDPVIVACGETLVLDDDKAFATREYFTYGDMCSGTYPGMELPVAVSLPSAGSISLQVSAVSPGVEVALVLLADWCNPDTCEAIGTNALTFEGRAGLNVVVIEPMASLPPTGLTLTVGSCP